MADSSIERFKRVVAVACAQLEERRQEINDLNVFPVADGDTGDNMALTMRHVLDELDRLGKEGDGDPARPEIVHHVARAALMGARGNSGVILSQIVRGAAEELATPPGRLIDPMLVAAALSNAERAAYASVREPAEGTMLTVIREMATAVARRLAHWEQHRLAPDAGDEEQNALLGEMLATALAAADSAVEHTPEQLAVLAENGVVDAGALGLAIIVRGLIAGLAGAETQLPEIAHYAPARTIDVHHTGSRYRYCTNFIVSGEGLESRPYVTRLEAIGDSVLVVGDETTMKVHVHTDDPESAKAIFADAGLVEREDIADMSEQIAEREARLRAARTGVVAVASGEGLGRLFKELGAVVVDGGPTLNPSTNDLLKGIEKAGAPEILLLPNSADVILAAEEAARQSEREVIVVASESQQASLAALVELDPEAPASENAERLRGVLGVIRAGSVAPAVKDDSEGRFATGDCVGFEGEQVVAWGDPEATLRSTLERLSDGAEIVTVIGGEDAPLDLDELSAPNGVELETVYGGQRHYYWLIAAQ
jgi:uncharacterized protein